MADELIKLIRQRAEICEDETMVILSLALCDAFEELEKAANLLATAIDAMDDADV